MVDGFEWDLRKELTNLAKHSYDFTAAIQSFKDSDGIYVVDQAHSKAEERYYWVGQIDSGRVLTVWFAWRNKTIRIIGCAELRKFRMLYYATVKKQRS